MLQLFPWIELLSRSVPAAMRPVVPWLHVTDFLSYRTQESENGMKNIRHVIDSYIKKKPTRFIGLHKYSYYISRNDMTFHMYAAFFPMD
jgi:hypothetical protein